MGRDAVITPEQVGAAAAALQSAGLKPTSRAVREQLGNVGSMGTIHRLLQAWRETQERRAVERLLPAPLQRAILDFVEQEREQARAPLEAELATQQHEAAALASDNERHVAALAEQQEALTELQAELATLQGRLSQMETELASARQAIAHERAAAEAARIELAKVQLRLEALPKLESDVARARREFEHEHQARVKAEQHAAVLQARLEGAPRAAKDAAPHKARKK